MRLLALRLCLLLASAGVLRATLEEALIAHRLLADIAESRVLRIERRGGANEARSTVFAVAFTFERLLWFYASESGTRVLGPAPAAWPGADEFARRLAAIDPSVERVTLYAQPVQQPDKPDQVRLTNACVVASIAALSNLLVAQGGVHDSGLVLLSYEPTAPEAAGTGFVNHCLLVYRDSDRWWCIDPSAPHDRFALEQVAVGAPLDRTLVELSVRRRYSVQSARLLPLAPDTLRRLSSSALWRAAAAVRADPRVGR